MLKDILDSFEKRRAASTPLPLGPKAFTPSETFVSRKVAESNARNWDHVLSTESRARVSSNPRTLPKFPHPLDSQSSTICLGPAFPSSEHYVWSSIAWNSMALSPDLIPSCYQFQNSDSATSNTRPHPIDDFPLSTALNYTSAAGFPAALRFITEHVSLVHDPPYSDWNTCLTGGTSAALESVFRMLCDRGDWILTEEYTYSRVLEVVQPLGIWVQGIPMDDDGLIPDALDAVLANWDKDPGKRPKPKALYTIPTGQNPTVRTQSAARRKNVLAVAEAHGLLLIEDDAYYFLQLRTPSAPKSGSSSPKGPDVALAQVEDYFASLPPSYLSLSTTGSVLRLDSFSKILAPGLRLGWMTGPSQLVDKYLQFAAMGSVGPAGFSQKAVYELLDRSWGHVGFLQWLSFLAGEYRTRMSRLLDVCEKHLRDKGCEWEVPAAGMFLWVKVKVPEGLVEGYAEDVKRLRAYEREIEERIHSQANKKGVIVSNGSWFTANPDMAHGVCFRLTFAAAPPETFDWAIEQFANALKEELHL